MKEKYFKYNNYLIQDLNEDDSNSHQNHNLLIDLEAKWNQIELSSKQKKQRMLSFIKKELNQSNVLLCSPSNSTFTLSSLIHIPDNSFEVFTQRKINELEQLKHNSFNNNRIKVFNTHLDSNNDAQIDQRDPYEMIIDNSRLKMKLKSVFSLIALSNEDIINNCKQKEAKPEKTFLNENEEKEKKSQNSVKYEKYSNTKSHCFDNNYNIHLKGKTIDDNEIKNKIKQNALLLKQLFPI